MNPYLLPEAPCAINFSGGRSSGYMLAQILDAYGGELPEHVKVVFANTGKERTETLDFIHDFERHYGVDVAWLEYHRDDSRKGGRGDPKIGHKRVTYEAAARNGEPFEAMLTTRPMLPNVAKRNCTYVLKVNTIGWYLKRECGWQTWHPVLGIRADEPRRLHRGNEAAHELGRIYPMAWAGATEKDIMDFWAVQDFDLKIDSAHGNCDLCFLKGQSKLMRLIRENPAAADWWIEQEEKMRPRNDFKQFTQFNAKYTFADLREMALSQTEIEFTDDDSIDCFCTD